MDIKIELVEYFHRMKYHVLLSLIIFLVFTILSYFYPSLFQSLMDPVVQGMSQDAQSGELLLETVPLFLNNFTVACNMLLGGIELSISTIYLLAYNGILIGFTGANLPLDYFLSFTLPHGIFELTAIVLAGACGFRITQAVVMVLSGIKLEGNDRSEYFIKHLEIAIKMVVDVLILLVIIAVLLAIAAYIEANITLTVGSFLMSG